MSITTGSAGLPELLGELGANQTWTGLNIYQGNNLRLGTSETNAECTTNQSIMVHSGDNQIIGRFVNNASAYTGSGYSVTGYGLELRGTSARSYKFTAGGSGGDFLIELENPGAGSFNFEANGNIICTGGTFQGSGTGLTGVGLTGSTNTWSANQTFSGIILANGSVTITGDPTSPGTNTGWKIALYSTTYALGVASYTMALKCSGWVSVFDAVNPANNASATVPDTNACASFSAGLSVFDGAIRCSTISTDGGSTNYAINDAASNSTIVARTSSGYIYCNYINLGGTLNSSTPTYIWTNNGGTDRFVRATAISTVNTAIVGNFDSTTARSIAWVNTGGTNFTTSSNLQFETNGYLYDYYGFRAGSNLPSPSSATRGLWSYDGSHHWKFVQTPADDRYRVTGQTVFTRAIEGEVYTGTLLHIPCPREGRVVGVKATLAGRPSGANFQVNVCKNGTLTTNSIFTSDTPISITTGASATNGIYQASGTLDSAQSVIDSNDILYVVISQVGSTFPGSDFVIQIEVA